MIRKYRIVKRTVAVMLPVVLGLGAQTVAADGKGTFAQQCAACHALNKRVHSCIGPNLEGVVGRAVGAVRGYSYSGDLSSAHDNGETWTAEALDAFLEAPRSVHPGTRMGYPGIADGAVRAELVDWLSTATDYGEQICAEIAPSPEVAQVLDSGADADYGEYLASECMTCHQKNGTSGVPPIGGLPPAYFVRAMLEFKNKTRENAVMQLMAGNLGNEELASLAIFFSER